jgi:hypothetical protein
VKLEQNTMSRCFASVVVAFLCVAVQPAGAQTANVAGTWILEVTTDNGVTTPSMMLVQQGETLSGTYTSEALGQAELAGTVLGSEIRISFVASVQGQSIPVVYEATIDENGRMSGTIDVADGMVTGTFTATRVEG